MEWLAREVDRRLAEWHAQQERLIRAALRPHAPGWMFGYPRVLLAWLWLRGITVVTVSAAPVGDPCAYSCEVRVVHRRRFRR